MEEIELHETQLAAVEHAISRQFAVITGGAGTGKTTIIKKICDLIEKADKKAGIKLCAFAGKAAARMKEATGRYASTIHSMLGWNSIEYTVDTLEGYTVIVDEASMVDSELMARIIERKPDRLILVGDEAQIPPVGTGQPFHDIINVRPEAVANLTVCFRNKEAVFKAATAIRNGEMPELTDQSEEEKWDVISTQNPGNTQKTILEWVKIDDFIDFDQDILLTPMNGSPEQAATVNALNEAIVDIVNPREGDEKWRPGDRVINTKNCREKDVWNGTTGKIHSIDIDGQIWVELDIPITKHGRKTDKVLFSKEMIKHLELAYALTVHKSQGSQYRRVIFCCLSKDLHTMLNRALIYTAVTRTREQCIVVGTPAALQQGIGKINEKRTVLQELARVNND